jgi:hypothetical protein
MGILHWSEYVEGNQFFAAEVGSIEQKAEEFEAIALQCFKVDIW